MVVVEGMVVPEQLEPCPGRQAGWQCPPAAGRPRRSQPQVQPVQSRLPAHSVSVQRNVSCHMPSPEERESVHVRGSNCLFCESVPVPESSS